MAANKIIYNSADGAKVLMDLSSDTVTEDTLAEGVTAHDASGVQIIGAAPRDAVRYATAQSLTPAQQVRARKNVGLTLVQVQDYGAKGDGTTDDTAAFQAALAATRVVFVPGGTYKLSGELVIGDNCGLELSQDTVLNFTQTSGNCITLNRSAFLKGNHSTLNVPYAFTGNAINVNTTVHTDTKDVPPWSHWSPQWKTARYLTDLNICKADINGVHQSSSGDSNGTAVYVYTDGSATAHFIWALHFSGLRIAGAFEYGVRAVNVNNSYNHEMRIEAFMDACKIGVSLEDCNNAYISAIVQPRKAANNATYAVHGIKLVNCENTDLSGSRVWDWNDKNSLWSYDTSNTNQHIAMYGNCMGTILNDYLYHYLPTGFHDIRELIYCDEAYKDINFSTLIVLQEPITRWFKPVDNEPYFNNGVDGDQRLVLRTEQDALFQTDYIPTFTDVLSNAGDGAGGVFNEIGYKKGYYWETDGKTLVASDYHTCTGFIPCKRGDVVRASGMSFATGNDMCRVILYDSSFNKLANVNRANLIKGDLYYTNYTETDYGFSVVIDEPDTVAYVTFSVYTSTLGTNPTISVNEEIGFTQVGSLADGIKVKEENLIGMEKYERVGRMVSTISASSTDEQYPSAKAVYSLISSAIGAAIGGSY